MLEISIIKCLSDNYSYLIKDKKTNLVGVVDPSDFESIDNELNRNYKKLDFILNTHHHNDHVGGNLDLKKKYKSKIICSAYGENQIPGADIKKKDGELFILGETTFKILYIPGHTLDHISFFSEDSKVVFTGDTLFSLGCGRVFEGTHEQMLTSIEKIKNLPKDTIIYCGHEYTENNGRFCISIDKENIFLKEKLKEVKNKTKKNQPTIPVVLKDEMVTNIFLRCDDKKIKNILKMNDRSKLEVFTKLRDLKDKF
jgi:hydroxyacylglutathione hydrolase|tara:strand:- start:582 stop:1346 length:765 start_codon:yes stop_codon:yes gene_type:complete